MRRFVLFLLLLGAAILFMGMEGMGMKEDFPEPDLDYSATVVDLEMITHQARQISVGGKTDFSGYRGKAMMTINFSRISRVDFSKGPEKTYVNAHVTYRDGSEVDLRVKGLLNCYGVTDLGKISIRMRDLKSIQFDKNLPKETEKDD